MMGMTTEEEARRTLLIEAQIELYRRQARWEPWKALAAIIAAAAVFGGGVPIWLAGQCVPGDVDATRELRARVLAMHLDHVEKLVRINAARLGTPHD